ncbi:MAG TPA: hypothetical protein VK081_04215 [Planctomycetota bacterium]|nr:hypothetical protein [Planctomycetota bacterium]
MHEFARGCAVACLALAAARAQVPSDPTPDAPADARAAQRAPGFIDPRGQFAFDPPPGWRALTPDEGRILKARAEPAIPEHLLTPHPPRLHVFGPIDRWLAGEFDGRALTVLEQDGEPDLDETGIAGIRGHFEELSRRGPQRFTFANLSVGAVGKGAHPAILGELVVEEGATRSIQFHAYVPSGGDTFVFALAWPTADRDAGAAAFAALCDGLRVAARPRGAVKLGGKLLWAALFGLAVGVTLHALRKRMRG